MTAIVVDDGPGARVHAFVVGVGNYPYCDDPPRTGTASRILGDLGSVTSPPPSAAAVAGWLAGMPRGDGDIPVGTVEVLISSPTVASVQRDDGEWVPVSPATFANFRDAFSRWLDRCDSDPGNIALFYFCGHGWHRDGQLLLLEDLGKQRRRLLESCVELSEIRTVMQHCRARTQLYFVDACRQVPPELLDLRSGVAPLVDSCGPVPLPLAPLDAPVYFSAARGFEAHADQDAVTPFTAALLRTLDGLGANREGSRWAVTTEYLGPHLREVIAWENPDVDRNSCLSVEGEQCGPSLIRTLDGPPLVPFRLTCDPDHALAAADVSIHQLPADQDPPVAFPAGGQGEIAAGVYHLELAFPDGAEFRKASLFDEVRPPNKAWHAAVERA
ncbi:hypothetical protein Ade02nite_14530 [Paractinoplanes deccanensis]|uniref:Peptidase C14 caspase domain-containing protein n=1 Tax=Paractinoplanes deccanensis TaxID=113561 RepID=A0ABQ3XYJ4_9ACTN|nr:caspase family protein [Actinoplanes deccanensis]GID72812.1 hypothetical protein Ade02nite_14530 [Actinoplanes deccanensis]